MRNHANASLRTCWRDAGSGGDGDERGSDANTFGDTNSAEASLHTTSAPRRHTLASPCSPPRIDDHTRRRKPMCIPLLTRDPRRLPNPCSLRLLQPPPGLARDPTNGRSSLLVPHLLPRVRHALAAFSRSALCAICTLATRPSGTGRGFIYHAQYMSV